MITGFSYTHYFINRRKSEAFRYGNKLKAEAQGRKMSEDLLVEATFDTSGEQTFRINAINII